MKKINDFDSIIISDSKRTHIKMIRSKNKFFCTNSIVWYIEDDCLCFRLPYFDETKTTTVNSIGKGWYRFCCEIDIPNGIYKFESDSTEDVKFIYFGN